jgi:hypothetical protein
MPTTRKRIEVLYDEKEFKTVEKRAKAKKLTVNNYLRNHDDLPPLKRGAAAHKKVRAK